MRARRIHALTGNRAGGLVLGELLNAAHVSLIAREWFGDEGVDEQQGFFNAVLPGANRNDIGVVVFASKLGGRDVPDQRCANPSNFVGGHLLAVARATKDHAQGLNANRLVVGHRLGRVDAEGWVVIKRVVLLRTVVDDLVTGRAQVILQRS